MQRESSGKNNRQVSEIHEDIIIKVHNVCYRLPGLFFYLPVLSLEPRPFHFSKQPIFKFHNLFYWNYLRFTCPISPRFFFPVVIKYIFFQPFYKEIINRRPIFDYVHSLP